MEDSRETENVVGYVWWKQRKRSESPHAVVEIAVEGFGKARGSMVTLNAHGLYRNIASKR